MPHPSAKNNETNLRAISKYLGVLRKGGRYLGSAASHPALVEREEVFDVVHATPPSHRGRGQGRGEGLFRQRRRWVVAPVILTCGDREGICHTRVILPGVGNVHKARLTDPRNKLIRLKIEAEMPYVAEALSWFSRVRLTRVRLLTLRALRLRGARQSCY